jgi:nitrite reductase/ring-hydroxylating ferredoxin subunit
MADSPLAHTERDDCASHDCFVSTSRRRFLRDTFLTVAGALVASGMSSTAALAMPLEFTSPRDSSGSARAYAIPSADGAVVDKDNEVILVRWQNAVYAFALSCPHQNTALKWYEKDKQFECPKHHSRFQPDGAYVADSGRATRNMDRFAIVAQGAGVAVDLDKLYEQDTDGPQWAAAVVKLR